MATEQAWNDINNGIYVEGEIRDTVQTLAVLKLKRKMAESKFTIFWDLTSCGLVKVYLLTF
jgi:hypothetical protein